EMATAVEIYSIDEAFMDLTGMQRYTSLETYGRAIQQRIYQEMHLLTGVGIAQTKTLAKLANYAAKKWTKTGGVVDLSDAERQRRLMALVPVEEVWGVGRRLSKKLNAMGVITAK
ncbi:DNA polymerase V subunit UmuC, partial [Escherichia coli]